MTRRRLSLENEQEKATWSVQQREANRRIVDARNNLEKIYQRQRQLNEAARIAEQEKKAYEIDRKIEVFIPKMKIRIQIPKSLVDLCGFNPENLKDITNRKMSTQAKLLSERLTKSEENENLLKTKANHRLTELKIRDHEDHLKHFQKLVQKDDDIEQEFYKVCLFC